MPLTFEEARDRKSTRLNSSHTVISYAVFCLKKKNQNDSHDQPSCADCVCVRTTNAVGPSACSTALNSCPSFSVLSSFFFFNDTATTEISTLSLHDALPIYAEIGAASAAVSASSAAPISA